MGKTKVIVHQDEGDLLFNPKLLRQGNSETHRFPLLITKEELKAAPELLSLDHDTARVYCEFNLLDNCLLCHMDVKSKVKILDNHDFKAKDELLVDSCDLTLSEDPEIADIVPDRNGCYDLRPTALALFYSSVPGDYSTVSLNTIEGDGFEVLTEEEYLRRKEQNPVKEENAFAIAFKEKETKHGSK